MKFELLVLFSLTTLVACASIPVPARADEACPNASLGETMEDCPWAPVARVIQQLADAGVDIDRELENRVPGIMRQLRTDSKSSDLKALWGESINFDELAKGIIVHPAILDAFQETLKVQPRRERYVHAGMEHTYGYLFSTLKTSFGYKRARWVRDDIETGFGLPRGILGPNPEEGTLLSNLTTFLGRIAFHDLASVGPAVERVAPRAAQAVRDYDTASLKPIRLVETLTLSPEAQTRVVTLNTLFVPFPVKTEGKTNTHLLIYWVGDTATGSRLISAFPVEKGFVDNALKPENLGQDKPVITRYNAYVEGVTDATQPLRGSRTVH
jgi:hypothetical protein